MKNLIKATVLISVALSAGSAFAGSVKGDTPFAIWAGGSGQEKTEVSSTFDGFVPSNKASNEAINRTAGSATNAVDAWVR